MPSYGIFLVNDRMGVKYLVCHRHWYRHSDPSNSHRHSLTSLSPISSIMEHSVIAQLWNTHIFLILETITHLSLLFWKQLHNLVRWEDIDWLSPKEWLCWAANYCPSLMCTPCLCLGLVKTIAPPAPLCGIIVTLWCVHPFPVWWKLSPTLLHCVGNYPAHSDTYTLIRCVRSQNWAMIECSVIGYIGLRLMTEGRWRTDASEWQYQWRWRN